MLGCKLLKYRHFDFKIAHKRDSSKSANRYTGDLVGKGSFKTMSSFNMVPCWIKRRLHSTILNSEISVVTPLLTAPYYIHHSVNGSQWLFIITEDLNSVTPVMAKRKQTRVLDYLLLWSVLSKAFTSTLTCLDTNVNMMVGQQSTTLLFGWVWWALNLSIVWLSAIDSLLSETALISLSAQDLKVKTRCGALITHHSF